MVDQFSWRLRTSFPCRLTRLAAHGCGPELGPDSAQLFTVSPGSTDPLESGGADVAAGGSVMSDSLALPYVPPKDLRGLVGVVGVNAGFPQLVAQKMNDPRRSCRRDG